MVNKVKEKLSFGLKFTYGFADVGFIWMVTLSNTYLLIFFTDVCGISPIVAGIIMTVGRILDTLSVPIAGPIIEKSNLKWGRYRSWLLIGAVSTAVLNALLFIDFSFLSQTMLILVGIAVYACFCIATNFTYIGYTSLNSSMTTDPKEKVQLSTARGMGNATGKIFAGWSLIPLIFMFGGAQEYTKEGFFGVAVFVSALLILTYLVLFLSTKSKKDAGVKIAKEEVEKTSVKEMYKLVISNKSALMLMGADILRILMVLLFFTMIPYFFTYIVKDIPKMITFFGLINMLSLGGAICVPILTKAISKKNLYRIGNSMMAICLVMMYLNYSNSTLVLIFACIGFIGYAWGNVVNTAMYADAAEYGFYKTGKNARALFFSVYQLSIKLAAVASTSVAAFGLAAIGFQAGVDPTPEVVVGIKNISMFLPAILMAIGVIFLSFYSADEKTLAKLKEEYENKQRVSV